MQILPLPMSSRGPRFLRAERPMDTPAAPMQQQSAQILRPAKKREPQDDKVDEQALELTMTGLWKTMFTDHRRGPQEFGILKLRRSRICEMRKSISSIS